MPVPKKAVFDSKLLPDGSLFCPKEFADQKNLHFKVIVTEENEPAQEASPSGIEYTNFHGVASDFLSEAVVNYDFTLKPPNSRDNIYHAILKGNQIQWTGDHPIINQGQEVSVLIKLTNEINPSLRQQPSNGSLMAQCLDKIAKSGGVASIADPAEWQREIRQDPDLYSSYEK